jgi:hypothetical protein
VRHAPNVTPRSVVTKHEGERPFGRPRHRWEGHIKMGLKCSVRSWKGFVWLRIDCIAGHLSTRKLISIKACNFLAS